MRGWLDLHCWNGLTVEQQRALIERGVIPVGMWPGDIARGSCPNPAEVAIEFEGDEAPGPRFYCLHCAHRALLMRILDGDASHP